MRSKVVNDIPLGKQHSPSSEQNLNKIKLCFVPCLAILV